MQAMLPPAMAKSYKTNSDLDVCNSAYPQEQEVTEEPVIRMQKAFASKESSVQQSQKTRLASQTSEIVEKQELDSAREQPKYRYNQPIALEKIPSALYDQSSILDGSMRNSISASATMMD